MKTYGGVEVQLHVFLTTALDVGEWSALRPGHLYPHGKRSRYPLDRRLLGPQSRSGHGDEKILLPSQGIEPRRPAHSLSTELSSPGSSVKVVSLINCCLIGTWVGSGGRHSSMHSSFATRCEWVVSLTLRQLYPWVKSPQDPLGRTLVGPRSGCGGDEKSSCRCWEMNPGRLASHRTNRYSRIYIYNSRRQRRIQERSVC
jgi:hypothetical protein